jgi:hypothetical protein
MAKDPAFLFYSNDFAIGTQFFTDEQVGQYLRLLLAQHQHGRLSEKQVNFICKSYDNDIMSKFKKDDNNLYYNERLEGEILKRKLYSESRSNNKKGKNKDIESPILKEKKKKSYDNHMENENEIENKSEKNEKFDAEKYLIETGLSFDLIDDFVRVRKHKKAPLTKTAILGIEREAKIAKISLALAIEVCIERNWIGFKADWYNNKINGNGITNNTAESYKDRTARELDAIFEKRYGNTAN